MPTSDRRRFLKIGAAAATGSLILPKVHGQSAASQRSKLENMPGQNMPPQVKRWKITGFHAGVLQQIGDFFSFEQGSRLTLRTKEKNPSLFPPSERFRNMFARLRLGSTQRQPILIAAGAYFSKNQPELVEGMGVQDGQIMGQKMPAP